MAHQPFRPDYPFTSEKLRALRQLVPEAFEDGKLNFETLRDVLTEHDPNALIEDDGERFGLVWPGKQAARRLAAIPSTGTLAPVYGEGLKADGTPDTDGHNDSRNVFIEGENLEVLKILQKAYAGRVKMIYIDPPYNTGNDFVYDDNFTEPLEHYLRRTGQIDEEGQKLTTNTRADGRFHSKWLSMMYPRLRLARNLLREDGVIFVSIDDNEVHNLRQLMNEVFGEENLLISFVWKTDGNFDNQAKIKKCHEYILLYCKNVQSFPAPAVIDPNTDENSKLFNDTIRNTIVKNGSKNPISGVLLPRGFPASFEKGIIKAREDKWPKFGENLIVSENKLSNEIEVSSGWSSKELLKEFINNDFNPVIDSKGQTTSFEITHSGAIEIVKNRSESQSHVISVLQNFGSTQSASSKLEGEQIYFDYPKPLQLLEYLISMNNGNDFIVLDFFAGSGSLAEAVINCNMSDNGCRRYVCVQMAETIVSENKAKKAGFRKITEIVLKRLRTKKKGLGFRCFKLVSNQVKSENDNIALDRLFQENEIYDKIFLLWEILLQEGFPLDSRLAAHPELPEVTIVTSDFHDYRLLVCLVDDLSALDAAESLVARLALGRNDVFVCLDRAVDDQTKLRLSERGMIKTI